MRWSLIGLDGIERNGLAVLVEERSGKETRHESTIDKVLNKFEVAEAISVLSGEDGGVKGFREGVKIRVE